MQCLEHFVTQLTLLEAKRAQALEHLQLAKPPGLHRGAAQFQMLQLPQAREAGKPRFR